MTGSRKPCLTWLAMAALEAIRRDVEAEKAAQAKDEEKE